MQSKRIKIAMVAAVTALLAGVPTTAGASVADTASTFHVDTTADTVDTSIGDGVCADGAGRCSLRAAVQEANASDGDATIVLERRTYRLSIAGTGEDGGATGDLDVTSSIVFPASGATIDAGGLDRAFDVHGDGRLELHRVKVRNGAVTNASGGAVRSTGWLGITDSIIEHSEAIGTGASGGAVFNDAGWFSATATTFHSNDATRAGGAIEANAGYTALHVVEMYDNTTGAVPGNGGAFHLTGAGTVDISDSRVYRNVASAEGGGVWNSAAGVMTVTDTAIYDNIAAGNAADEGGGGVFNDGGRLTLERVRIDDNQATGNAGSGGGILNNLGTLEISDSKVRRNTAPRAGGGIEANVGVTVIRNVVLDDNTTGAAPGNGGGFHVTGAGSVTVDASRVRGNFAANEGGGLWNSATGTMTVTDTVIKGNGSPAGPDVFNVGGVFTIDGMPVPPG